MNDAGDFAFKKFCQLCADISKAERDEKSRLLLEFMETWRKNVEGGGGGAQDGGGLYPIMRCLLPQLDRERGAYGVKENTLAKIYIRILCLPKNGSDAVKLLEYRVPKSAGEFASDFAEVAYWILRNRCSKGEELTVDEVNAHLDTIAMKHAANDPRGVESELTALLRETSANEQKWLIRIILKEMKLGMGHRWILRAYHPDAAELHDSCNDLRKVCATLADRTRRLNEIGIDVFTPFRPMLSEECDVGKMDVYLRRSPRLFVETKFDGERFQLHMSRRKYKYFSRNGRDYTSTFGMDERGGSLTPELDKCVSSDVDAVILDGEMMCWDSESKSFVTKGMNTDVKNLKGDRYRPCFCVFDVLHVNGRVLTNAPLRDRSKALRRVVASREGVVRVVEQKEVSTKEEVWECLNEAIENRDEGIIAKDTESVYKPNARKNGGWLKVKPEYTDGLMDSLDVLILGGYYGGGRHKGRVSHFLVGVAESGEMAKFHSAARVGSGYSMDELFELQVKLQPHWREVVPGEMPPRIEWTREKPDVWIEPDKSFILQVKASEIMASDSFKTSHTLRFPRVERVRYDKSWTDCLTLAEFEEKRKAASGKLVKRSYESVDGVGARAAKTSKKSEVGVRHRAADLSAVETRSNLLAGMEICVFSGFRGAERGDVERRIAEFGGTLVQNPGSNTFCVLAEEESNVRISNVVKCGSHDVVRTSWFVSQLTEERKRFPELRPEVLLGASEATRERLSAEYDEYGDHYTEAADAESLKHSFGAIEKIGGAPRLSKRDMRELDFELFSGPSPYAVFRECVAYFDVASDASSSALETAAIDFEFGGGTRAPCVTDATTHVVVSEADLTRLHELEGLRRERAGRLHVVTGDWIEDSARTKTMANEGEYRPR